MTHRELRINQHYIARVSGRLVPVRLDGMEMKFGRWQYHVENIATGRKLTFYSCQKFRFEASNETVRNAKEGAMA